MRDPSRWRPVGVESIEPAAEEVVRSEASCLVVAGPGAGKTELLAQRACYLLQTGACPLPQRILAISFKRDAARNLRERVAERCGRVLASRFDSYTFDSFAKSLVDRFRLGIPEAFRPTVDYQVDIGANKGAAKRLFESLPPGASSIPGSERRYMNRDRLWEALINRELARDGSWENRTREDVAAAELWEFCLRGRGESTVSFPMIGRIAGLLFDTNPMIVAALRRTFPFVFLDEYQDTTRVQYALVRKGFRGSGSVLTAVGDKKQRIMGWAGAMEQAFDTFSADFGAERTSLLRNYRSSPGLVEIQGVLAEAIDASVATVTSMRKDAAAVDECRMLCFADDDAEAEHVAMMVRSWIVDDGVPPRDVCILCRKQVGDYTEKLLGALDTRGVQARIENDFQDLLAEPITEAVLDILKLACHDRCASSWMRASALFVELSGDSSDRGERQGARKLLEFSQRLGDELPAQAGQDEMLALLCQVVGFLGEGRFRARFAQYQQGTFFADTLEQLAARLADALRQRGEWAGAIDELEGVDSVPVMTTHKSKGLEYHSIVFIGLEDGAFFAYGIDDKKAAEELCGVFVALSRAKERAIFTFSEHRRVRQGRDCVSIFFKLLEEAGVAPEDVE